MQLIQRICAGTLLIGDFIITNADDVEGTLVRSVMHQYVDIPSEKVRQAKLVIVGLECIAGDGTVLPNLLRAYFAHQPVLVRREIE